MQPSIPSKYPHIEWHDLYNNGVMHEVAVMNRDQLGNVMFFPIASLDIVDRKRLLDVVTQPSAQHQKLYDLMATVTLKNGLNALSYFHQFVRVLTPGGAIIDVDPARRGFMAAISGQQGATDDHGMTGAGQAPEVPSQPDIQVAPQEIKAASRRAAA